MFPIYHKDENFVEPEENFYYVLAANGLFQIKRTAFFTSSIQIFEPRTGMDVGWLEAHDNQLTFHLPKKLPAELVGQIVSLFREVFQKYSNSEAIVLVYWNTVKNEYEIVVPEQKVGAAALPYYEVGENPPDCIRFGTIHSHGSLAPFHSPVDNQDEVNDDGIHVTVGNLNQFPAFACSIMSDGQRFTAQPDNIMDIPTFPHPPNWLERIQQIFGNQQVPGMRIPAQVYIPYQRKSVPPRLKKHHRKN